MAASTANGVADYLLWFANEHGDLLTPLKLQKLMFYADAWHMVLNEGEELVPGAFEAWVHGPVHRATYNRFSAYRWNPIPCEAEKPQLPEKVAAFLDAVYGIFGGFSGYELEQLTHQETPWKAARGDLAPDSSCTALIDKALTRSFYTEMSNSAE
jgi:uncharacterized phage-associated protein